MLSAPKLCQVYQNCHRSSIPKLTWQVHRNRHMSSIAKLSPVNYTPKLCNVIYDKIFKSSIRKSSKEQKIFNVKNVEIFFCQFYLNCLMSNIYQNYLMSSMPTSSYVKCIKMLCGQGHQNYVMSKYTKITSCENYLTSSIRSLSDVKYSIIIWCQVY